MGELAELFMEGAMYLEGMGYDASNLNDVYEFVCARDLAEAGSSEAQACIDSLYAGAPILNDTGDVDDDYYFYPFPEPARPHVGLWTGRGKGKGKGKGKGQGKGKGKGRRRRGGRRGKGKGKGKGIGAESPYSS